MFEVKTRFRFSSEGGVGEKTRFGGGRLVIGTPSLSSHKYFSHISHHINLFLISLLSHKHFTIPLPHHIKYGEPIQSSPYLFYDGNYLLSHISLSSAIPIFTSSHFLPIHPLRYENGSEFLLLLLRN